MFGLGQMVEYSGSAPRAGVGLDPARREYPTDARFWIASARWAQRAINAWRAAAPGRGALIYVDGQAGPITITALRAAGPGLPPTENSPAGSRVTDHVIIAKALAERLAAMAPVADPPRPRPTTTTRPSVMPGVPGTAVAPAAAAAAVLVDEGTSQGLPQWVVPALVVGGVVLVGSAVIIGMSRRKKVAANRRRKTNKAKRKGRGTRPRRNGAEVARTILQQLGGTGRLSAMIGAKNFVDIGNGVQFSFAGKRATGNKIVIKLNARDTYDVEFWWIRGADMKLVHEDNDVYADNLRGVIESQTGMRLSLNRRRLAA